MYPRDTIVARATPPGRGAVAIVRLSGDASFRILERTFTPSKGAGRGAEPWRLRHGTLFADARLGKEAIDEVLVARMPGPASYTGEDVAEIHCHGSPVVCERIIRAVLALGARPAERGEFTRRAVLNGRMDLVQAEAVADLIDARMDSGARAAWEQLQGALSGDLARLRSEIVAVIADLEATIDFADEDLPAEDAGRRVAVLDHARRTIAELLAGFPAARRQREGCSTVFTGRPNVGKSSLVNALLGHARMIVSDEPGTTRDSVEEVVEVDGVALVLTDTAGVRDAPGVAEGAAVDRARMKAEEADIVVAVVDGSRSLEADERAMLATLAERAAIVVVNKVDLPAGLDDRDRELLASIGRPVLRVCALSGDGIADLSGALRDVAQREIEAPVQSASISRLRHRAALERADEALSSGRAIAAAGGPPELASIELRAAASELAAITHPLDNEEILDEVFGSFCIGK